MQAAAIIHAIGAVAIVIGYVVLELAGHDGDALLGTLGGYIAGGAAVAAPKAIAAVSARLDGPGGA